MKKVRDRVYEAGVVICFLSAAGFAEAITGEGSQMASIVWLAIGLIMCLVGYVK